MSSDSDKDSTTSRYWDVFLENLSGKVRNTREYLRQKASGHQREFTEFTKHHLSVAGDCFCRLFLSLLPFAFSGAIGLFIAGSLSRGPVSSPLFFQGLLFGWVIVIATVIVYGARFLVWARRASIAYWAKRTPPFESTTLAKHSVSPVEGPSSSVNVSKVFWNHLTGALLINTLAFYGVLIIWSFTSITDSISFSNIIFAAAKAVGLLYGGVVGVFATGGSTPSSLNSLNELTLALLVFAVVFPSLPLTIAVRNFGYWLENELYDAFWSQGTWGKVIIVVLDVICIWLLIQSVNFEKIPL